MKRIAHKSQYFLRSPRRMKEMIGHSNIKSSDTVYDIGAGSGVISSILATRSSQVIAYENDSRIVAKLRENVGQFSNVTVIEQDFLKSDLPNTPYKVFSNIPFHLSSPILRKLTESDNRPTAIYLIVQKQFAHKLLIDDERFTGLLGAQIAPLYTTRIRMRLERTDYWPHPAVDTVLIELLLRDEPLIVPDRMPAYRQFTAHCYEAPKIFAKMPQSAVGITSGTKPSQLTLDQWVALFDAQSIY
ncbi:MAG: rRNA adenine N(6)-methyltransferase family protein [Candidatus Nomurabacteria bacterium]|nr:MAG: rRNA adenine N(6)-methyltransferase family protein [Candidatus Nomurabacteria bacterium]